MNRIINLAAAFAVLFFTSGALAQDTEESPAEAKEESAEAPAEAKDESAESPAEAKEESTEVPAESKEEIAGPPARIERNGVVDHSFVFFTVDNNRTSVNGKPRDDGWTLKVDYRIFGRGSKRDAFKFVVKQGNRKLGETICEVYAQYQMDEYANGPPSLDVVQCRDRDQRIKQTGALKVEVYHISDATDQATHIATHDLLIRSVKRVRGTGEPDAPHHYVDRHSEVLSSFMMLQHNRAAHPYARLGRGFLPTRGSNRIILLVNMSPSESRHSIVNSSSRLRCSVNGTRIEIPEDRLGDGELRYISVEQSWGKGNREQRESIQFRQFLLTLPLSFSSTAAEQTHDQWHPLTEKSTRWPHIDDHPGNWECEWRINRDVYRTFRFTVGEDGRVVPHPEQSAGLELGPNIFLVETEIPAKGTGLDSRVHRNSVNSGAFLGRGFKSPEGKALVRKLPNVGQPTPRSR